MAGAALASGLAKVSLVFRFTRSSAPSKWTCYSAEGSTGHRTLCIWPGLVNHSGMNTKFVSPPLKNERSKVAVEIAFSLADLFGKEVSGN
jgi:hypothetical protein